jgi:hypothetical protein
MANGGGGGLIIVLVLVLLIVAGGLGYWFFGRQYICKNKAATTNVATWKSDKFGCIVDTCADKMVVNSTNDDCVAASPAGLGTTYTTLGTPSICRSAANACDVPSNFKNIGTATTPVYADSSSLDACKTKCSTYTDCLAIDYVDKSTPPAAAGTAGDCYYYTNTTKPTNPSACVGTVAATEPLPGWCFSYIGTPTNLVTEPGQYNETCWAKS